jgi:hypothetical protein
MSFFKHKWLEKRMNTALSNADLNPRQRNQTNLQNHNQNQR